MIYHFYDMDETTVNSHNVHLPAHLYGFRKVFGLHLSPDEILPYFGSDISNFVVTVCGNNHIVPDLGQITRHIACWEESAIKAARVGGISLMPGVPDCLYDTGVTRALVTCTTENIARVFLQVLNLEKYFPVVVCGMPGKTKKDLLEIAVAKTGAAAGLKVMFDDSVNGISSGRAIGAYCVGITNGKENGPKLIAAGADTLLHSLEDYRAIPDRYVGTAVR